MPLLETLQHILDGAGWRVNVQTFLLIFGLLFARLVAILSLVPFLGGPSVSSRIKVGLSAVIAATLLPHFSLAGTPLALSPLTYVVLLAKEIVVGSMIGFIAQLVFYAIRMAGIIIDTQRGMNQITYLAPELSGNTSILGSLKFQAALVIFLSLGGHLTFLRIVADTFSRIPLLALPRMQAGLAALADQAAHITGDALRAGLALSAPIVAAIFLVDVGFACLGKVAPQIRISGDSNTVKSWVGLALFFLAAALLLDRLPGFFAAMLQSLEEFSKAMS